MYTAKNRKAKNKEAIRNFIIVCDKLEKEYRTHGGALHLAWKKPMKFFREHTPTEAIEILKREALDFSA